MIHGAVDVVVKLSNYGGTFSQAPALRCRRVKLSVLRVPAVRYAKNERLFLQAFSMRNLLVTPEVTETEEKM